MSAASNTAPRPRSGRGAAARSTVDFHGLKVKVPTKLPGSLAFDYAAIEQAGDDDEKSGLPEMVALLTTLVGAEQVAKIRAKSAEIAFEDVATELGELIGEIMKAAGTTAGK